MQVRTIITILIAGILSVLFVIAVFTIGSVGIFENLEENMDCVGKLPELEVVLDAQEEVSSPPVQYPGCAGSGKRLLGPPWFAEQEQTGRTFPVPVLKHALLMATP